MTPFTTLRSLAAPMADDDIDTDIIFPARFLLLTDRHGLGRHAFHDRRFDADGHERPAFVLNREPWRGGAAAILVAGANFGCGSSREQAPWALADLGIRCIVARSFGEIFRANCYANGLLPVALGNADHARVLREAAAARPLTVDLMGCWIGFDGAAAAEPIAFDVPERQRAALLAGLDEIDQIGRTEGAHIASFESAHRRRMPWLFGAAADTDAAAPSATH